MTAEAPLWIFGYGSLLWAPGFPWEERVTGWVTGWSRRFYQGSPDHRGTPESPGRVVTLIRGEGERCRGVAYRVPQDQMQEVLSTLDHREVAGYDRRSVVVFVGLEGRRELQALTYVAGPDNPQYLGPASLEEMATHVLYSVGPSGSNLDYLARLSRELGLLEIADAHVAALQAELTRQQSRD
jgi:cation transport protein ChaC